VFTLWEWARGGAGFAGTVHDLRFECAMEREMLDSRAPTHGSRAMTSQLTTRFSHVRPQETPFEGEGLRDFFLYRDLGIAQATGGKVIAQLVKANHAPERGTGWHRHEADFHIVIMLKGWARFMYGDQETLVAAGDCVHQAPGIVHYLFDYSEDMEYLEIVSPADFKSIDVEGPCEVPAPTPWASAAATS
jgi:quercetin dioxygenase-like cupin family protein